MADRGTQFLEVATGGRADEIAAVDAAKCPQHGGAVYVDEKGDGWLVVKAQDGKRWLVRGLDGTTPDTSRKRELKTQSSYRVILLAPIVTHCLQAVVDVFHTSPDGAVDMGARLIPVLRSDVGGQAGFRNALHRAASQVAELSVPSVQQLGDLRNRPRVSG